MMQLLESREMPLKSSDEGEHLPSPLLHSLHHGATFYSINIRMA
jgi:hypothetical protein